VNQAQGLRLLLLAVFLFGGIWPISRHALADATPLWFATSRAALAACAVTLVLLLTAGLRLPRRADLPALFAIGGLQVATFFLFTHLALALVGAGRTAVLSNVTLMWLVPLSMLVLGEGISPLRWAAAGVASLGVGIMMGPWAIDWSAPGMLPGHLLLLAAGLAWSIAIIITRRFPPVSPVVRLLPWSFALAALMLAPAALLREPDGGIGPGAYWHAAFIGLVAAPLGTWAVTECGRHLNAVVASVGFLLVPVFGLALATVWLHEPLGWDLIVGGVLIVVSVVLAARG
jgi:O-acetylserine/cysteine efflux transporter